jgi:hypothetical protein
VDIPDSLIGSIPWNIGERLLMALFSVEFIGAFLGIG